MNDKIVSLKPIVTVKLFFLEVAVDFGLLKTHCFLFNRPIRLTQCCTQFKTLENKTFVSGIYISFTCEYHIIMQMFGVAAKKGTLET